MSSMLSMGLSPSPVRSLRRSPEGHSAGERGVMPETISERLNDPATRFVSLRRGEVAPRPGSVEPARPEGDADEEEQHRDHGDGNDVPCQGGEIFLRESR